MNTLTLEPPPSDWEIPSPPERSPARAALGLPENTTIIMTGHQAEAWHPGVAAKFYLARAIADALSAAGRPAAVAWLTPDHVTAQPFRLAAPLVDGDRLVRGAVRVAPDVAEGSSVCAQPARTDLSLKWDGGVPSLPGAEAGAHDWCRALKRSSGEPNAARQAIAANVRTLGNEANPDSLLFASSLAEAGTLDDLIQAMRDDPVACTRSYNDAAAARPVAGVGVLEVSERTELPLWDLRSGRPRRVFVDELGYIPTESLAPRALTMTLLARRSLCEVFIHGTGGGLYDPVMEDWARRWLGETALAPIVTATATFTLPLDHLAADEKEIDRTVWLAQAARHDPALLGDVAAAKEKRRLADSIAEMRSDGEDPSSAFKEMHALLERVRRERAGELERIARQAEDALKKRGTQDILRERAWALALHDDAVREQLIAGARDAASALTTPARSPR